LQQAQSQPYTEADKNTIQTAFLCLKIMGGKNPGMWIKADYTADNRLDARKYNNLSLLCQVKIGLLFNCNVQISMFIGKNGNSQQQIKDNDKDGSVSRM